MKNIKSKILSLAALTATPIATVASLASCSENPIKEYHIVNLNDLHGAVPGYGEDVTVVSAKNPGIFRWYQEALKITTKYPGSILLSAGDENSGDSWSTCYHGLTTYPILREMGVRYCAVGNHAFEWGYDDMNLGIYDLFGRTKQTVGNYFVTSNIFRVPGYSEKEDWVTNINDENYERDFNIWNEQRVKWADPYKIINFGNAKVCLIGLTTTGTLIDGNASVTKELSFIDYKASVHYSKYLAYKDLGADEYNKIDSFILFTHCAGEQDKDTGVISGEAAELAKNIDTDVDGIISAHSHKDYAGKLKNTTLNKDVCIVQAGTAAQYLADTKLVFDHSKPAGKKLKEISMNVKKIPVPTDAAKAKAEWTNFYTNPSKHMTDLANEYSNLRGVIKDTFEEKLTVADLVKSEMQPEAETQKFDGYYNGIKYAKDEKGEPVQPGHAYYDNNKNILDHFGGWLSRCLLLGYYYHYYKDITDKKKVMPSCTFITQDTSPSNLKNGDVKVREIYDMVPYDNKLVFHYLNIFQLANMINYWLSGKPTPGPDPEDPSKEIEYGFKYHEFTDNHKYQPDLRYYCGAKDDTTNPMRIALNTPLPSQEKQQQPELKISSSYTCGPLSFHGIWFKVTENTEQDKAKYLDFSGVEGHLGKIQPKLYDLTATYRVATKEQPCSIPIKVGGNEYTNIYLPEIKVFEYHLNEDGTDNLADLDADPQTSESWKDAEYWATKGTYPEGKPQDTVKLIPCATNWFMFCGGANKTGGNNQCNGFREYSQFNIDTYGIDYQEFETEVFARDIIETFLRTGIAGRDWKTDDPNYRSLAPINIAWEKIKQLVSGLNR